MGRWAPFTKHWGPGPRIVCRMSQRSTDTSDRIHYQWTSAVAGIVFQSLTVAAIRRHLKENDMLKILAACHSGAPFQPGALRTCVPCLMVNPALEIAYRPTLNMILVVVWMDVTNGYSDQSKLVTYRPTKYISCLLWVWSAILAIACLLDMFVLRPHRKCVITWVGLRQC